MDILQKKLASEDEAYKPTAFWASQSQNDLNYSRGLSYRRICISHCTVTDSLPLTFHLRFTENYL